MNTVMAAMGFEYATKAPRDLFMDRKNDRHPTAMAQLFGMRLVVCMETAEGGRLDEAAVKELTGSDPITARRMREAYWTFNPTRKGVLITNHKPEVRGTDDGLWRRPRLIPFAVRIPEAEQDKRLPEKLRAELPGVLAWLVRGCLLWQREGLDPPDGVKLAIREYRDSQDLVGQWLAEFCVTGNADYRCRASDLHGAYKGWCERCGERPASQRRFGETLAARGFERLTSNGTWYLGIGLNDGRGDDCGFPQ